MSAPAGSAGSASLRRSFGWMLAGNGVFAACQWGLLAALAKLTRPEEVGRFTLGLAITAPIFLLTGLQLRSVLAADRAGRFAFAHYFTLRLVSSLVALAAVLGIVLATGLGRTTALVVLGWGLARVSEAASDLLYARLQQLGRLARLALSLACRGLLALAGVVVVVALTGEAGWAVALMTLAWVGVLVVVDLPGATQAGERRLARRDDAPAIAQLARSALPLGLVTALVSLIANLPRYSVQHWLGERELGLFAALASLLMAGDLVVNTLGQSALPRLAQLHLAGERGPFLGLVARLVALAGLVAASLLVLAIVAGGPLLSLVYRPEYGAQARVFVILACGTGLGQIASTLGYALTAAGAYRMQVPLFAVAAGLTLAACWALVPAHGLLGAALASVCSASAALVGLATALALALRRPA